MLTEEIYPNSPLAEVVCEMRFPGEPMVECRRHEFYEAVRGCYPNVLVPAVLPGQAPPLEPYRFEREDGKVGVMVALNRLALYARQYPGYSAFAAEFQRAHEAFGRLFALDRITRLGWRYINVIPFARHDGLIPLGQYLKLGLKLPAAVPERFQSINLEFVSRTEGGTVTTRLATVTRPDGGQEALLLDFDYGKEGELRFNRVKTYLDEAHRFTRGLFEELITDEYRQYLRGEVFK